MSELCKMALEIAWDFSYYLSTYSLIVFPTYVLKTLYFDNSKCLSVIYVWRNQNTVVPVTDIIVGC